MRSCLVASLLWKGTLYGSAPCCLDAVAGVERKEFWGGGCICVVVVFEPVPTGLLNRNATASCDEVEVIQEHTRTQTQRCITERTA